MQNDRFPEGLGAAVARVRSADGTPVGSGFLLAPGTVVTCAHVVAQALDTDARADSAPTSPVTVEFPLQRGSVAYEASVSAWRPVAADGTGDIALLRLPEDTPGTLTTPVPLAGAGDVWDHRFRILAFPATAEHGAWIGGRLLGAVGQGWISMEAEGTAHHISPGCSGAPVWDEQLAAVVGMTVATDRGRTAGTSYLIPAAALLDLQPGLRRCPYRGLDAFREEDAEHFFGREKETQRLLDAVDRHLVVPVVGPSGSGKTSLVRAGALPHLRAAGHTVSEIRALPGTRASLTLARALAPLLEPDLGVADQERSASKLAALLDSEGGPAAAALGLRLLHRCGPRGHVFFLNQLEETVAAEPATARTLLALVVALASVPAEDKRLRVLATLRSACLDDLVEPATAHVLSDCAQIVAPLGRTGLLGAIEGPASRIPGLTLDPGLAERIVDDAENEPGHLPMVEFALTELWSLQAGVRLTHSGYEALGGVTGALSTHAEKRVGEVIAEHGEDPVRRLFVQLARPDDGGGFTRRPARLADLPPGQRAAAEALAVRTRFLRITQGDDGAVVADLAHEALTRKWEQLRVWLEESRRFRTWQEQVREQRALWEEEFRDPGRLLRGVALETALSRSRSRPEDVSAVEREFIQRSVRHRRRGLRRWRAGAATVALLLVVSVVLAVQFGRSSAARAEQLRQQASQALAAEAGTLSGQSPSTSLQLSLAALNNADTPAARQAVLDRYLAMRSVVGQRRNAWAGSLSYLVASAGGDTVVSVSNVGDTVVWRDWAIGGFTRTTLDLPVADASALELSDDGCLLAAVVADRVAVRPTGCPGRWRSQVLRLPRGSGAVDSVDNLDFDAEGRLLLAYETSSGRERDASRVVLWDRGQGKPPRARSVPLPGRLGISEARLLPQGQGVVLLTGTPDEDWDQARAWSLDGSRLLRAPVKHAADLLPDGRILVEQLDRPVAVHDAVTGRRVRGLSGSTASGIDMTGCCLVDSAQAEQQEAGTIDLLAFTPWDDGRRYYTTVPTDREAETFHDVQPVVKRVSANRIRVLLPAGSDLLVVEAEPAAGESLRPRGGSTPSVPDRRGRFRLVFTSNRELQLVGRASEFRSVRVPALGTLLQGAVFTSSGRRAVVWDAFGVWSYSVPALKDRVTLVRSTSLGDIVPLAGDRLAVITDAGLEWIDAATGERLADPVRAVRRDCVRVGCSLAAIPKHPDHVSVLADGVLRIRDLSQGRLVGRPLELGARVARGSGRHVVFGPDGRTVALVSASSDTVSLRNVAGGGWLGRRLEEPGVAEIVDFSEQGLLLQDTAGRIRFWDLRSALSLRLNLPPRGAGGQWHSVEAWRLDEDGVSAVFGGGEQLAVPLDPNRWLRTLCARAHADRDFLQEELREAPAGMETTAPCAAHRKGVAGR